GRLALFVGRMIPAKGVDVLLEAQAELRKHHADARLLLCGDGPQRAAYEALAKKLGVADSVIFAGAVQQADLPHLYALADVFVLPSTYHHADGSEIPFVSENFGLVIAEAMSCETPVVAANVGGIPLWIDDNKVARLFTERDAVMLAGKLEDAMYDVKGDNARLVRAAKQMIEDKYSWEAVIRQFAPLFKK
ncbi:MAG TPA: glycosyltransferase family 4 protein, partial [Ktedonobacteraceae bacterium]|nr:glycosyltransferase family 4 protein [Ktedonobacteraceae bacterium]